MNFYKTSSPAHLRKHPMYGDLREAFFKVGFQRRGHSTLLAMTALRTILPVKEEKSAYDRAYERNNPIVLPVRVYPRLLEIITASGEILGHTPEQEGTFLIQSALHERTKSEYFRKLVFGKDAA